MFTSSGEGTSGDFITVPTPGISPPGRTADHIVSVPDLAEKQQHSELLPAEEDASPKDDVPIVINGGANPCNSAKESVQSLQSRHQGKNRDGPLVSTPSHSRSRKTLPSQLLFPTVTGSHL